MDYKKGDKFIFEISDAHTSLLENKNYYSIKQAPYISFSETTLNKFEKIEEEKYRPSELEKIRQEAYEKGMEEAWKIAGLISKFERDGGLNAIELRRIFGCNYNVIFAKFSIKEAKELIEKHFPEKLNQPLYNIGDVVEKDGIRGITLDVCDALVFVWTENGTAEGWAVEKVTKTDAHCDLMPVLEFVGKR